MGAGSDLTRNSKCKDETFESCNESGSRNCRVKGKKHCNFPNVNSQSALQTTESYHRNRAGRAGVGADRETRGFKEETLASEIQVEGEKKSFGCSIIHLSSAQSAFPELFDTLRTTHLPTITETVTPAKNLHHIFSF